MSWLLDMLSDLSHWTEGFAEGDWAIALLSAVAFSESFIFPIPPDPLLFATGQAHPSWAIWLAALVTVASVAGAVIGHWLGRRLGRPLLDRLVSRPRIERAERLFSRYGAWAILIAAFTPIPYKVFTVLAGVLDMKLRHLVIASLVGRGARFLTIGALIFVFGDEIRSFIDDNFETLAIATGAGLVALVAAVLMVGRFRRVRRHAG
jgi:undecaprenyl-diphosphatase